MFERNTILKIAETTWRVAGMVFKPDGSVDWYFLIQEPQLKDPYANMIYLSAKHEELIKVYNCGETAQNLGAEASKKQELPA